MTTEGVTVVIPLELESGFRLAGVETVVAGTGPEAIEMLDRLVDDNLSAVIAVYEPFLNELPSERQAAYDASVSPVVVTLPAGLQKLDDRSHRARISAMLSRAVGYHITFGEEIS